MVQGNRLLLMILTMLHSNHNIRRGKVKNGTPIMLEPEDMAI